MAAGLPGLSTPRIASHGIQITLPNIPAFVPAESKAVLADLVLSTMRLALQDAAGHISDEAPRDSGGLAQSFGAYPATSTGGIELTGTATQAEFHGRVFSSLPHAIVMDQGRRAGAPISRAGIDAIGLWAQRKLGLSADQADSAKWAIASTIVARGLVGTGYFDKGVKAAEPRIQQMFSILGQQIAAAMVNTGGRQ